LIITLWLFQILNNYSYRETLEKAKDEGFNVPSLCDYHYRVKRLDDELLKSILEECAKLILEDKQTLCYIADATGFGFGDKYNLNWKRGTQIRTVQSHVRLEAIIAVDENKLKIITAVETGGPYESEIEMLRKALKKLQPQKGLPFIADKGYDAVDIIESLLDRGFEPAIRIKETMRMSIRHPLRKLSNENWKRYGKMRYRVEQLFGSIKQKIGSSFKLLREDLARKASIACAILWNFWVLATYLFLLFLSGILHYSYA
jgi:Transposase DDE domain.